MAEFNSFLSIEKQDLVYNVSVYPNPTNDKITIESENIISTLRVFDAAGYIVYELKNNFNSTTIDLSKFTSGAYIIEYEINNRMFMKKVIKN